MLFLQLFIQISFASRCDYVIKFNTTTFSMFFLYKGQTMCLNTSLNDWSFIINEGVANSKVAAYYKKDGKILKVEDTIQGFNGFHLFGSDTSIEINFNAIGFISFAVVAFSPDCDIRIVSNYNIDKIDVNDWASPEQKLCYFNGLNFRSAFSRSTLPLQSADLEYYNGNIEKWGNLSIETQYNHPPVLKLNFESSIQININSNYSAKMHRSRSFSPIPNNPQIVEIVGQLYDPYLCEGLNFSDVIQKIAKLNSFMVSTAFFIVIFPIIYIVTYCFCCPCCCLYRPQCLKPLKMSSTTTDNNVGNNDNRDSIREFLNQEQQAPVYLVYQQQPPAVDGIYQPPMMTATNYPPPGVYEPVTIQAPIVSVIIND